MELLHLKYYQEASPLLPFLPEEAAPDKLCVSVVLQLCLALLPRGGLTRQEGLCATERVTSTNMSARRGGERELSIFVSQRDSQLSQVADS